ncbi:isoprenylcysteine carboxylmethyltransferase family protein [Pseudoflavitalea sp. G-6-1-2]|uniref:methyltransferase family protein n=1 Tax=Pseudoflavitalea sp. G-6-1-2 TaxID=2728841 RepID=UPI00146BE8C8|nr:isoprenylcysteine carboxylmethyltransferase family protein [Pseudoflavitalea sp. G-6-1-2]NML21049.1 isoprenylcysteine carboxylmethyltransferase family protein [Pseudoflavitalea sp. G-6-1-2]
MYGWLIAYWLLFGLLHSLLAAEGVKRWFSRLMGNHFRYYRLYYSLLSFMLLGGILFYQYNQPDISLFVIPLWLRIPAWLLLIAAIAIMSICIRKYFFHLSGIDVLFPAKQQSDKLETGGLNRYVRHPLYSGTILLVICLFVLFPTGGNLVDASMIILYTCIGTLFEEKKLRRIFGEAYKEYQQRVPMLLPYFTRKIRN